MSRESEGRVVGELDVEGGKEGRECREREDVWRGIGDWEDPENVGVREVRGRRRGRGFGRCSTGGNGTGREKSGKLEGRHLFGRGVFCGGETGGDGEEVAFGRGVALGRGKRGWQG